jgi:hypothetical protein
MNDRFEGQKVPKRILRLWKIQQQPKYLEVLNPPLLEESAAPFIVQKVVTSQRRELMVEEVDHLFV